MSRPIFFCHIPKTAGTTLRLSLEAAFRPFEIIPDRSQMARNRGRYPPIDLVASTIEASRIPIRLVRGHYHYSLHELLDDPIKIVVLREPVARTISLLKHMIAHQGRQQKAIAAALDRGRLPCPDNQMVRFLSGSLMTGGEALNKRQTALLRDPIEDSEGRLAEAKKALKGVDILGLTERLGLVQRPLQELGITFSGERRNEARIADLGLSEQQLATIRKSNELDISLYAEAVNLVEAQLKDSGLENAAP